MTTLPARAQAKLAALIDAEDEVATLVGVTQRKISELFNSLRLNPHGGRAADQEHEVARLQGKQAELQQRNAQRAALNTRLRTWSQQLGPDCELVDAKAPKPKLKDNEDHFAAINRVRDDIAKLVSERLAVKTCGLPVDEMKAQAEKWVHERALKGRPRIRAGHDTGFEVSVTVETFVEKPTIQDHLAWLDPDAMIARLHEEIDTMPIPKLALTPSARQKRLTDIAAKLLDLERIEEALIEAAEDRDQFVPRRPNADPQAILGVTIAKKAKAATAA